MAASSAILARTGSGSCALNLHACTRDLVAPRQFPGRPPGQRPPCSGRSARMTTARRVLRVSPGGVAMSPPRRSRTGSRRGIRRAALPRGIHLAIPLAAYWTGAYAELGGVVQHDTEYRNCPICPRCVGDADLPPRPVSMAVASGLAAAAALARENQARSLARLVAWDQRQNLRQSRALKAGS